MKDFSLTQHHSRGMTIQRNLVMKTTDVNNTRLEIETIVVPGRKTHSLVLTDDVNNVGIMIDLSEEDMKQLAHDLNERLGLKLPPSASSGVEAYAA